MWSASASSQLVDLENGMAGADGAAQVRCGVIVGARVGTTKWLMTSGELLVKPR